MKKAVFYGRYSSANQTDQSIEGQLHVCEKFAAENDIEITAHYIDRAMSATSDKRPQFQQMIADSKHGTFDTVLVYKLDRFARNRYDSALYKRKLRDNGVRVVSATENITDTPEGIIMEGLLEAMDEYYSAELSRKCRRGIEESFRKGRFRGRNAPFGYKVIEHKLAIDDTTAPIAREVFERFAAGEKQAAIMNDLNARGIPNAVGNKWNKVNMSIMLQSPIYKGVYRLSTLEGEVECPAIVTAELWDKVQKEKQAAINRARAGRSDYDYILTGKLVCGECGRPVCGHSVGKGKRHYYRCSVCQKSHVPADDLHNAVKKSLAEYLNAERAEELAAAAYREYIADEAPQTERELIEKELAEIERKIANGIKAVLDGASSVALQEALGELEKRRDKLNSRLDELGTEKPHLTQEYFEFALRRIAEYDFAALLKTVVNCIIVKEEKIAICINLTNKNNTPPLEMLLLRVKESSISPTQSNYIITLHHIIIIAEVWKRREMYKSWVIKDRLSGRRYHIENLEAYIRRHPQLFGISGTRREILRTCYGFYNAKRENRAYKHWDIEQYVEKCR